MAELKLTAEQKRIRDLRNSNILVSAAAGSGKTAVLVERIISQIMDKDNPKDVDRFLVVTFTKAAAAQMREKISNKISALLEEKPDDQHLIKQITLLNRADITTIDSFCLKIVKENFSTLDIDSSFSIGDSGMMELMKSDVIDALFEKKYKEAATTKKEVSFFDLVDIFCNDKEDTHLKDEILKVYNVASSYPMPHKWLINAKETLQVKEEADVLMLPWLSRVCEIIKNKAGAAIGQVKIAREVCMLSGGPDKNIEIADDDERQFNNILEADSYEALQNALDIKFARLKVCKGDAYNEEYVEEFKTLRNAYKNIAKELANFKVSAQDIVEQLQHMSKYLIPLIELVEEFSCEFMKMKKARRLMEFADIEHMAYELVCKGYDENNQAIPTAIGEGIAERYDEIYIDEYQDSNYLQEDILTAVSGISKGIYNMFMVGDVKQSIYKFRMARPDLFIKKYDRFSEDGNEVKIELKNNFRSRKMVLDTANFFFYQLMGKDLGGIMYDDKIALVASDKYKEYDTLVDDDKIKSTLESKTEILIAEAKISEEGQDESLTDEQKNMAKLQLEAAMISERIKRLVSNDNPQYVYDENKKEFRKAQYKDIVILSRSIKGFGDIVFNTLMADGIPAYIEDPKGYFDATEIKVILSFLSVIDNSYQDIPLAAVLLSPVAGLNENHLAVICNYVTKNYKDKLTVYEQCQLYCEEFDDDIASKLKRFMGILDELKEIKANISISELIWKMLDMTGYYLYASAMPQGNKRKANINMLLEKATAFENGAYKGLFNFLRYIERMKINDVDFGEANILSDDDDVVRIISMHKSKGLEYPIVFVSGLGRQFNSQDVKNNLIVHSDYYLASMLMDNENRIKKNSLIRECFKNIIKTESISEEFRVLYVAMTRAKEKMILTGCENGIDKIYKSMESVSSCTDDLLPYDIRLNQKSFMRWIMAATLRENLVVGNVRCEDVIEKRVFSYEDIVSSMGEKAVSKGMDIEDIKSKVTLEDGLLYEVLKNTFDYKYPYEEFTKIKSKMSISEIKRMKAHDGVEYEIIEESQLKQIEKVSEEIIKEDKEKLSGSERGTIVHKFMELLPFKDFKAYVSGGKIDYNGIRDYIKTLRDEMLANNIFDQRQIQAIDDYKICKMLTSNLGLKMIDADARDELFKEQQFSIGIPVTEIYTDIFCDTDTDATKEDDVVIVQGIIDAYFYDGEQIVLMDYKTDYATEEKLIGMYKAQLDYYGMTLEKLTNKKVSDKVIYSFNLNAEIKL